MPHHLVTVTANDSWPQPRACLGSVRSVMRPVEITKYFLERFALMKDLLYGKVFGRVIGTDLSSKTWGTSHTYVAIYGLHPSIEKRK